MKSIYTFLFIILFFNLNLNAQISPIIKKFGGLDRELLWRVAKTDNNLFYGLGGIFTNEDTSEENLDILITKFDIEGTILESYTLGHDGYDWLRDLIVLPDESMVIVAVTRPYLDEDVDNTIICRITPNGSIDWIKQFGTATQDISGSSIIHTSDNNILVAGTLTDVATSNEKGILLKMNLNGSVLFRKQLDESPDFDVFTKVRETTDGYLAGGFSDFIDPDNASLIVLPIISKFDFNGNLLWTNAYDSGSQLRSNDIGILVNADGSFVVSYGIRAQDNIQYINQDLIVMKIAPDGSVLWSNRIGNGAGGDDFDGMNRGHNDEIIICGDLQGIGSGQNEAFVLQVDQSGNFKQVNLFGGEFHDYINFVQPFSDDFGCNGYMLVGSSESFNADGSEDAWIIKTDETFGAFNNCITESVVFDQQPVTMSISSIGSVNNWNFTSDPNVSLNSINFTSNLISECSAIDNPLNPCVTSIRDQKDQLEITIYPSPTSSELIINGEVAEIAFVEIYNSMGQLVKSIRFNDNVIDVSDISNGIYLINFSDEKSILNASRKFQKL